MKVGVRIRVRVWVRVRVRQQTAESVNNHVVAINHSAKKCNFGQLREEMTRDRIAVGILDQSLFEDCSWI